MLEILALYFLCKRNARVAADRGYRGGVFGFVTAAAWVVLELFGGAVGFLIGLELYSYILALAGAGLGAAISLIVVASLPDRSVWIIQPQMIADKPFRRAATVSKERVWCIQCGRELAPGSRYCEHCGVQVPTLE